MIKQLHAIIRGKVQGVFFRAHAEEEACGLGITGWVKNRPDGAVEILAEGEQKVLDEFLEWCYKGSPGSKVDGVESKFSDATGEFKDFGIKY